MNLLPNSPPPRPSPTRRRRSFRSAIGFAADDNDDSAGTTSPVTASERPKRVQNLEPHSNSGATMNRVMHQTTTAKRAETPPLGETEQHVPRSSEIASGNVSPDQNNRQSTPTQIGDSPVERKRRPANVPLEAVRSIEKTGTETNCSLASTEENNLDAIDEILRVINDPDISASTIAYRTVLRRIVKSGDQCVVLCQLLYWYGQGDNGKRRMSVRRAGRLWLAKTYDELGAETGMTGRQARQSAGALVRMGLVECRRYKFRGLTMCHFRIIGGAVQLALENAEARS